MTIKEFWEVVASRYADKPDSFVVSVGHSHRADESTPLSIRNLPEIVATVSVQMSQIREWLQPVPAPAEPPVADSATTAPEPEREWRVYPASDTFYTRKEAEDFRAFYAMDGDIQWRTKAGQWQEAGQ